MGTSSRPRGGTNTPVSAGPPVAKTPQPFAAQVNAHPVFEGVPRTQVEKYCLAGLAVSLAQNEELYVAGDKAHRIFLLLEGALQIEYPDSGSTRGRVVAILVAPAILGEGQLLNGSHWSGTGVAISDVAAIGMGRELWLEALETPSVAKRAYIELSRRFLHAIDSWRQDPGLRPEHRLARYLVSVSEARHAIAKHETEVTIEQSQASIARAAGIGRETANRIAQRWSKNGIVELTNRRLTIRDEQALRGLVNPLRQPSLVQYARFGPERSGR